MPGEVRLVNGDRTDGNEGRVEICYKGQWGTVCDVSWDYYDAEVVRRHLAWSWHNRWANFKEDDTKLTKLSLSGSISYTASKYGWGTGPVFFNNVACTGSQDSLAECSHSYFGDVSTHCKDHSKDASVYCGCKYSV